MQLSPGRWEMGGRGGCGEQGVAWHSTDRRRSPSTHHCYQLWFWRR